MTIELMKQAINAAHEFQCNRVIKILSQAITRAESTLEAEKQEPKSELNDMYCQGRDDGFEAGRLKGIKQEPVAMQMDVIVGNLIREGINKHRARELAEHFIKHTQPKREPLTDEQRDAARYRWLRSDDIEVPQGQREIYAVQDGPSNTDQQQQVLTESALDEAIDAAIEAAQHKECTHEHEALKQALEALEGSREQVAAIKTLAQLGYTYLGGELWKPPIKQRTKLTQPKSEPLTVRLISFPESNGKSNWTAMFVRAQPWDGLMNNAGGITIDRGECWNRVAYSAERARFLLGERATEPSIMDYCKDIRTPEEWDGTDNEADHGIKENT